MQGAGRRGEVDRSGVAIARPSPVVDDKLSSFRVCFHLFSAFLFFRSRRTRLKTCQCSSQTEIGEQCYSYGLKVREGMIAGRSDSTAS